MSEGNRADVRVREQEAKKIERMLNKFREEINKEAGCEVMPYKAKVVLEEKSDG